MLNQSLSMNIHVCYSFINIEYKDGYYQVYEGATSISKHKDLNEAQLIKSVLESEMFEKPD